jgi:hypothetical protein
MENVPMGRTTSCAFHGNPQKRFRLDRRYFKVNFIYWVYAGILRLTVSHAEFTSVGDAGSQILA